MLRICILVFLVAGAEQFPTDESSDKEASRTTTTNPQENDEAVTSTSTTTTTTTTTTTEGPPPDFFKYRWDEDQEKYIRLGTTDTCPANMRFYAVPGNATAGQCDCDYYQCTRPLLYSPKTKECHFAWSRGPCEEEEWYAFNAEFQPICEPRKCTQGLGEEPITSQTVTLSYWFTDPIGDGQCYEASTDDTCVNDNEALFLYPGDPIPKCRQSTVCVPLARPEPQLCFRGNRRYYEGHCIS